MKKTVFLTIEYDGTGFHGWQRQPEKRTVQGELERVLSIVCADDIHLEGTGRTDAGVHAKDQHATFESDFSIPIERIPMVANKLLAERKFPVGQASPDVRILKAEEKPKGFHARFDCIGKTYRYVISIGEPSVFRKNYCYYVRSPFDIERMRKAAVYICGKKDFASFEAAGGNPRETTVRTVKSVDIIEKNGEIYIDVTGDGFLYNMVRIIAGTLIDVAMGLIEPEEIPKIIEAKDRTAAGHTAPAHGLYLQKVYY